MLEDVAYCISQSFPFTPNAPLVGIIKGNKNKEKKKENIKRIIKLDHTMIAETLHASLTGQLISTRKKGMGKVVHFFSIGMGKDEPLIS